VQRPIQAGRQIEPGCAWHVRGWPPQGGVVLLKFYFHFRTEMKRESDIVHAAVNLVDDVDPA
jgi:hypothetical protein